MKKFYSRFLAVVVVVIMAFGVASCGTPATTNPTDTPTDMTSSTDQTPATTPGTTDTTTTQQLPTFPAVNPTSAKDPNQPLVIADNYFTGKFSFFYAMLGYDQDISDLTQLSLMDLDRSGAPIMNGMYGETNSYNGTDYTYYTPANLSVNYDSNTDISTYTATIRPDLVFSDGVPVTADDLIFTYYTCLDPNFDGFVQMSTSNIIGLKEYQTGVSSDIYSKYNTIVQAIIAAGPDHVWSSADTWTQDQQDTYWAAQKQAWEDCCQAIVDYEVGNDMDSITSDLNVTADAVNANVGLQVAGGMAEWGYATVNDDGSITTPSGLTFTLQGTDFPTIEDYYNETFAAYGGDPVAFFQNEISGNGPAGNSDPQATATNQFITQYGQADPNAGAPVNNISGITKLDNYTVQIQVQGYSATDIYNLLGIDICPMHYYGDANLYNYDNNQFGFNKGDMSLVSSKTSTPLGAGAYTFVSYTDGQVNMQANPLYWKGQPATKYLQFPESSGAFSQVLSMVLSGTADWGVNLAGSKAGYEQIQQTNSNGQLTGDVLQTIQVMNPGFGYIGINASNVAINGDPGSDQSKDLRKAFATIFAVLRDSANTSYYGDAATTIQYPSSLITWGTPTPADPGYQIAFSTDVNGNPIYTPGMTPDEQYAAAEQAALGYFQAAGYTVENGKVTAPPPGNRVSITGDTRDYMSFEILLGSAGSPDHPAFGLITDAINMLADLGITLTLNNPSDASIMWNSLAADTQDMWFAAFSQNNSDPDCWSIFDSSQRPLAGGTTSGNNMFDINDPNLDQLLVTAQQSTDQAYRKTLYMQIFNTVLDWGVCVPDYQRMNCQIISTQRVNTAALPGDISSWYDWKSFIELIQMQ